MNFDQIARMWESEQNKACLTREEGAIVLSMGKSYRHWNLWLIGLNAYATLTGGAAIFMFVREGWRHEERAWALFATALFYVAHVLILLATTWRLQRQARVFGASVKEQTGRYLAQVNHWIWLAHNYLRWFFLPGLMIWSVAVVWWRWTRETPPWFYTYVLVGAGWFYLIQWFVRRLLRQTFVPRQQQLQDLLRQLGEDLEVETVSLSEKDTI
jgi:hypothetical protein